MVGNSLVLRSEVLSGWHFECSTKCIPPFDQQQEVSVCARGGGLEGLFSFLVFSWLFGYANLPIT